LRNRISGHVEKMRCVLQTYGGGRGDGAPLVTLTTPPGQVIIFSVGRGFGVGADVLVSPFLRKVGFQAPPGFAPLGSPWLAPLGYASSEALVPPTSGHVPGAPGTRSAGFPPPLPPPLGQFQFVQAVLTKVVAAGCLSFVRIRGAKGHGLQDTP